MQTNIDPIPKGYHSITPYLVVSGAEKAIEFYKKAFGAKEVFRMDAPEGKIGHCELQIGDSRIMMADEFPDMGIRGPSRDTPQSFSLLIYVENVDEVFNRAVAAGAKVLKPLTNEFYGDRMGKLQDPFGHIWNLGMQVERVTPEEMQRRADEMYKKH